MPATVCARSDGSRGCRPMRTRPRRGARPARRAARGTKSRQAVEMPTALWKMNGDYFGFRDGDGLWDADGDFVGKFHGDEVFDLDGRYLGEIRDGDRLIRKDSKAGRVKAVPGLRGQRGTTSRGTRGS